MSGSNNDDWIIRDQFDRIVAIGDIHGDLDALVRILLGMDLLNQKGDWIAKDTCLILLGDLNDRGPDSVGVIDFVMQQEAQARSSNSQVYSLLGNHELMAAQGEYRYASTSEVFAYENFWYKNTNGLQAIYRHNSPYAQWLRKRPTILKAANTIFVHAGLDSWIFDHSPSLINSSLCNWVAHFQGVAEQPRESSYWMTDDGGGPLWTRRFRIGAQVPPDIDSFRPMLRDILETLDAKRIVSGHNPTSRMDYQVAFPHPFFDEAVAVIDTGISKIYEGRLSAIEVDGDTLAISYFERGDKELELTGRIRTQFRSRLQALADSS